MVKQGKRSRIWSSMKRKPKNAKMLKKLAIAVLVSITAALIYTAAVGHTKAARDQQKLHQTYIQLNLSKAKLVKEVKAHDATQAEKQKQIEELNKQLQDTQKQLEAKRNAATVYAAELAATPAPVPTPTPVAATYAKPSGDTDKAYIYGHESGNNPAAVNSIGCRGLGQACPGEALPCGNDYDCQDQYFTNYMLQRYGSWAAARAFWEAHSWW